MGIISTVAKVVAGTAAQGASQAAGAAVQIASTAGQLALPPANVAYLSLFKKGQGQAFGAGGNPLGQAKVPPPSGGEGFLPEKG